MKLRIELLRIFLIYNLFTLVVFFSHNASFSAQEPSYKLITSGLVPQGETFTGVVVEETEKGSVPLGPGDEVVFKGEVVPVKDGGKVTIPAFVKELGNTFIEAQITPSTGSRHSTTITEHVEVVSVRSDVPTKIVHVSDIVNPGALIRVQGQGLNTLGKGALVSQDGTRIDLGEESFGSSLEQIRIAPKVLDKGAYRFIAWDKGGNLFEAPNEIKRPSIQLEGTRIRHIGEKGEITINSDTNGKLILSGGEPQITLHNNMIDVRANLPARVGFTAKQLGEYTVSAILLNPEDIITPDDSSRVDVKVDEVQASYNPTNSETAVTAPVLVVDDNGQPMSNVTVDIAVSYPRGVEYGRVTTDSRGRAKFSSNFSGQISPSELSTHVYRVLEHQWKVPLPCDCSKKITEEEDPPSIKLAPFVKDNWQNLRDRIDKKIKGLREEAAEAGKEGKPGVSKAKNAEADKLDKQKPPKTPKEYENEIGASLKSGKDFEFTILKGGAAMALADGSAVFGDAAAFAIQSKIGKIDIRNIFTAEKDKKSPLETKKIKGKLEHKLLCSREDCDFIGAAATFIGLKGLSEITNLSEVGASDEEFKAMKEIVEKIPIPEEFPVLGQIKELALKFVNLKADIKTRVRSSIKVKSDEFSGIDDEINLKASARLSKTEDAEVYDKLTSVGNKEDEKGRPLYDADIEFARGTSTTNPSSIIFTSDVDALSKALGIGAAHSQINSAWGAAYIFSCICKEEGGKSCENFDYNVIANVELGREIDSAMKRIQEKAKDWDPPTTIEEAEKLSKKLEKLLKEEVGPIFK